MATKKKPAAKAKRSASAGTSSKPAASKKASRQSIAFSTEKLVMVFTALSVLFLILALMRY